MIESCHTCKFWAITTFTLMGQCRRRAPIIDILHDKLNYPETPMQHWCGEYKALEDHRIEQKKEQPLPVFQKLSEFLHGEVNASVQSQSEEVARVGSVDRREEQSASERDCGATDSAKPTLLQATSSDSDDRTGGAGVGDTSPGAIVSGTSGRRSLIENKCQDCLKKFMIDFESAVCNDCYSKRQGRKRHYMG